MLLDLDDRPGESEAGSTAAASSAAQEKPSSIEPNDPEPLLKFDRVPLSRETSESSVHSRSRANGDRKLRRRRTSSSQHTASSINYHGVNIYHAAAQGSLPLCVLLWGMASAKRVSLMAPDLHGNNPMHHAAFADTAEVGYESFILLISTEVHHTSPHSY